MREWIVVVVGLALVTARLGAEPAESRRREAARRTYLTLAHPNGLALDGSGNLFITDIGTHRLLKLDPRGVLTGVAGTGEGGFNGDGAAAKARLFAPHDVAFDAAGNLLVADTYNHRIRRIDRKGMITTLCGDGGGKYAGDNGPALNASLNNPQGIALGSDGTLFIADTYNHVVRRVDPKGTMTTFAGTEAGLAGDGGPANRAQLSLPTAVAVGPDRSVYISDSGNNRIRLVKPDGTIETVLGSGPGSGTAGAGFAGDGGPVERARIFAPTDLELNASGDLILSDSGNNRVRLISKGVITTIAGSGTAGFGGDGGPAVGAAMNTPQKIALGKDGSVYIADRANRRVRRVDPGGRMNTAIKG